MSFLHPGAGLLRPLALVSLLLIVAAFAVAPLAAAEPGEDLVAELRKKCANPNDDTFHGVLIRADKSKVQDGKLYLNGYCDGASQRKLVEDEVGRLLSGNQEWKKAVPNGVSTDGLAVLPLRSKYLSVLQDDFGTRRDRPEKESRILRKTRLDDVYFDAMDKLVFVGVCPSEAAKTTLVNEAIHDATTNLAALESLRPVVKAHVISTEKILPVSWDEQPTVVMQNQAARDPKLDGALFWDFWYDKDGVAQIEGFVRDKEHLAAAEKLLGAMPADSRVFRPAKRGKGWSLAGVTAKPELTPKVGDLQARLATDEDFGLRQIRLDRLYFHYPKDRAGLLDLRAVGVCLNPKFNAPSDQNKDDKKKSITDRASQFLEDQITTLSPSLQSRYKATIGGTDGIRALKDEPRGFLEPKIAKDRALDGVGIARDVHYYDETGRLVLRGVWRDPGQEKALRALVSESIPIRRGLIRNSEDFDLKKGMVVVPTGVVLQKLREWVADNLEDARVDRLYFDEGRLKLEVRCTGKADRDRVHGRLQGLLDEHVEGKFSLDRLISRLWPEPKAPRSDVRLVAYYADEQAEKLPPEQVVGDYWEGWAKSLRGQVQVAVPDDKQPRYETAKNLPDGKWDGIRLDRGYFTPEGQYALSGLVSSEKQLKELDGLLREKLEQKPSTWAPALGNKDWKLERMKVLPLEPMLARMRLVFPAYEAFDGMTLVGARHNAKGELHLRVRVIRNRAAKGMNDSQRQDEAATAEIKRQLDEHDVWKVRANAGVRFIEVASAKSARDSGVLLLRAISAMRTALAEPQSFSSGGSSNCLTSNSQQVLVSPLSSDEQRKILAAARLLLDAFLLNDPDDSAGWFLRGLCYHLDGDAVQARRDVRRMVELERVRTGARRDRLTHLESFQGGLRRRLNLMEKNMTRDVIADKARLTLSE